MHIPTYSISKLIIDFTLAVLANIKVSWPIWFQNVLQSDLILAILVKIKDFESDLFQNVWLMFSWFEWVWLKKQLFFCLSFYIILINVLKIPKITTCLFLFTWMILSRWVFELEYEDQWLKNLPYLFSMYTIKFAFCS